MLVTGAAGFIGMHVSKWLLERGDCVVGVDNMNEYYDVRLKQARLVQLEALSKFEFHQFDISDAETLPVLFNKHKFDCVIHLAAQAGVRYSIENPNIYISSNVSGFINILECCRHNKIQHLVYASSSSVYGGNVAKKYSEHDNADHPISLYAATKKSNELMAHAYSHLFNIPTTGLRFFTVYGPWGRPDMAYFIFVKAMLAGQHIDVFNNGEMSRDFTYIDDIVSSVLEVLDKPATDNPAFNPEDPDPATSSAPYRVFNIGNSNPTPLMSYVDALGDALGIKPKINMLPMQPGDVLSTSADTTELFKWVNTRPSTSVKVGVKSFVQWYLNYFSQ